MATIYERADIYDLLENQSHFEAYQNHWNTLLEGRKIQTLLDVSIGSGSVTLPLLNMGVTVVGSDLSEKMLEKCQEKAKNLGKTIELKCSDFRELTCWKDRKFDCVASTGNSLPHVENADVLTALEQMDSLVKPGGYLYLDTRNWDKIEREHNRFYLYDPVFIDDTRVNLVQVWDYNADCSMTFNLLYTFEKENKIVQKEKFDEHYYPIAKEKIVEKLKVMGYSQIEIYCFPAYFKMPEFERVEWYCIMAKKEK